VLFVYSQAVLMSCATELVMLFTNDGDTIYRLGKAEQAGVNSCLTLMGGNSEKVLHLKVAIHLLFSS
jgi:hypothetical protein